MKRPAKQGKWVRTFVGYYSGEWDSQPLVIRDLTFDGNRQEQGPYDKYELEQALSSRGPRDIRAILARLDAEYPITAKDLPPRRYDIHDRRQAAAAIRNRLVRRRARAQGK